MLVGRIGMGGSVVLKTCVALFALGLALFVACAAHRQALDSAVPNPEAARRTASGHAPGAGSQGANHGPVDAGIAAPADTRIARAGYLSSSKIFMLEGFDLISSDAGIGKLAPASAQEDLILDAGVPTGASSGTTTRRGTP
jgi:hypothetical protein